MKSFIIILLTVFTMDVHSQADIKYVRKGNSNYNDGKYQQAEVEYRKALEKDPASYKADYNLGNALYKQKQYDAAGARYSALIEKETDKKKLGQYYYNLGNTMFENKKYEESIEAYKKALRNNPSDMDAKHNLQMALKMLVQQQQQNQQQKNQSKNDQNKQNQDKNSRNQQNKDQQNNQQDSNKEKNNQGDNQQNSQPQSQKGQISREDAERILQALENEEKKVLQKVQDRKEHTKKVPVDKNW